MKRRYFQPGLIANCCLLVFIYSCKKDSPKTNSNEICITVKDKSTQQLVEGASVSIDLLEDLTPQSGGGVNYGTTSANGVSCIDRGGFAYMAGCSVSKSGYEPYCFTFSPASTMSTFEVQLLKRDSWIKFHFINQPPVFASGSLSILINYTGNFCSGAGSFSVNGGLVPDTIINYPVIQGDNGIAWNLYRNNALVSDSAFYITALPGDTTLLQIEY
jgi:hypothetical protein